MRTITLTASFIILVVIAACLPQQGENPTVARGKYLVESIGCVDCHTPHEPGQNGIEPDLDRYMSGHPAGLEVAPPPALEGPWAMAATGTMTAWSGPWGISFTANLTPDEETGLGKWTAETFIATMRNGRHLGNGRPVLPPMPVQAFRNFSDDDLRAIFAYLRSLPPIRNKVPAPLPPASER